MKSGEFLLDQDHPIMLIRFWPTFWCNFKCDYCNASRVKNLKNEKFKKGLMNFFKKKNYIHGFKNYSVQEWIDAFKRIKKDYVLDISGGEAFIEFSNFINFLENVSSLNNCKFVTIDTNGSWSDKVNYVLPENLRSKINLNISYHPTQVSFDVFSKQIEIILNMGFKISMINYVMEKKQVAEYEKARNYFKTKFGIYVNPNPDSFGDANENRELLKDYLPDMDLAIKTRMSLKGQGCLFPSIAYFVNPIGEVQTPCVKSSCLNFIKDSAKLNTSNRIIKCPKEKCKGLMMYAFSESMPTRGLKLDLYSEYADQCKKFSNSL